MATSSVRLLIVDDYEPWCQFVRSVLSRKTNLHIVGEVADGVEAVQRAAELRPDLVLLDIGLPRLNGIDASHQIHHAVPEAKILFASQNHDRDVVRAALSNGAKGYLLKSDGEIELLSAIEAVIRGEKFVSQGLRDYQSSE